MKSFSQRKNLKPASEVVQVSNMNDELRNGLWNVLDIAIWSTDGFVKSRFGITPGYIAQFSLDLWANYLKKPIDTRPTDGGDILEQIRNHFFKSKWHEVYDFLEFVVQHQQVERPDLAGQLNRILEREVAGYRFISGIVTEITSEDELSMLEEAMSDSRFSSVSEHLRRALELFSSRDAPDYRNSIKESISAVEAMAKLMTDNAKAMLPEALKLLERQGKLHAALREGFIKLYGYTSDEQGIRHAMLDIPNLSAADARFFLFSCTSFVSYLKTRIE